MRTTDPGDAERQPRKKLEPSVALDQNSTIIAVVEMSQSSWLVGGILPGIAPSGCLPYWIAGATSQSDIPGLGRNLRHCRDDLNRYHRDALSPEAE